MKSHILAASVLFLLAGASLATADEIVVPAQSTTTTTTVVSPDTTRSTTVIAPEQETVIHKYIKSKPIASISLLGIDLSLGSTVPKEVELHKVEAPDVTYQYATVNDHTVLVDPETRRVVEVIN